MTYFIKGKLVKEEKANKYINRFVDFKRIEDIRVSSTTFKSRSKEKYIITDSEIVAYWLNKRGSNLEWNADLERAIEMCARKEVGVSETKLLPPPKWEAYLTQKFGETKEERTLNGKLEVWKEIRLPIPWFYVASFGKLEDVFVFNNNEFVVEPMTKHDGKKVTTGVILDTPIFYLGVSQTKTRINTSRYSCRYRSL